MVGRALLVATAAAGAWLVSSAEPATACDVPTHALIASDDLPPSPTVFVTSLRAEPSEWTPKIVPLSFDVQHEREAMIRLAAFASQGDELVPSQTFIETI